VYTLCTTCHQFSKSSSFLWTYSYICYSLLNPVRTCHSHLTDVIFHKNEIMCHKYCLSLTRHFEGQLLNIFWHGQWQYVSFNIYISLFLLYTAITICKNFMKYQVVKKPWHFNTFKKTCPDGNFWVKNEGRLREKEMYVCPDTVVPSVLCRFQEMCGYISVMATLKVIFFLN
jgi:hypothetical protein